VGGLNNGIVVDELIADSIVFDNSSNGFTATNIQSAIEEAKVSSSSFDENLILIDNNFDVICDEQGNVLKGL
jgi:hypothetical protein